MWHCLQDLKIRSVVSGVPQVEQRSGAGGVGVGGVFPSIASSFLQEHFHNDSDIESASEDVDVQFVPNEATSALLPLPFSTHSLHRLPLKPLPLQVDTIDPDSDDSDQELPELTIDEDDESDSELDTSILDERWDNGT